jgi:hypothetical protein
MSKTVAPAATTDVIIIDIDNTENVAKETPYTSSKKNTSKVGELLLSGLGLLVVAGERAMARGVGCFRIVPNVWLLCGEHPQHQHTSLRYRHHLASAPHSRMDVLHCQVSRPRGVDA